MTYCEYIEKLLHGAAYFGQRLFKFHISFGKHYLSELNKEINDIQNNKKN